MLFRCLYNQDGIKDLWTGKIIFCNIKNDLADIYVESRSSIHIIIGKCKFGNFVCIPNFNTGCYLSDLNDIFWNTEKLSSLLGNIDGITAAEAIRFVSKNYKL